MDVSRRLSFVRDFPPVIHFGGLLLFGTNKAGQFYCALADVVVCHHFLVHDGKVNIVANVLDINLDNLVSPSGSLACVLLGLGAPSLHARLNNHVRIHLAQRLSVMG